MLKFILDMPQTQIIAAAAAGIAAEGLSPLDSKAEAENAAQVSVALVDNAIVLLMLVEDRSTYIVLTLPTYLHNPVHMQYCITGISIL